MAQTRAAEAAPGIYLDLAALPPTPRRLAEILNLAADCGYGRVAIEWGSAFPWSLDARFRASYAYPEEVVAGIARQAAAEGIEIIPVAPAPDGLDFIYRHAGYRHLFRAGDAGPELDMAAAGGAKLYRDLVEDLFELLPQTRTVALASAEPLGPAMGGWLRELGGRGVRVRPLAPGGVKRAAAGPDRLPADALVLCDGRVQPAPDSPDGELSPGCLLLSFQASRGSPLLRRSIELSLDRVVDRAPAGEAQAVRIGAVGRQSREAADRLDRRTSGAWDEIRMIREGVALATLADETETASLEVRLARLRDAVATCAQSSGELLSLLEEKIEAAPLQAAVASLVEPLEEELHLLIPRVQLLGRRSRRP